MRRPDMEFPLEQARRVKLLLFDVDGVMTDGRLLIDGDGRESKQYHIRDGTGLVWARQAGLLTGFLSARASASTTARARQLGVSIIRQGADDKLQAFREILAEVNLTEGDTAYMGDDVLDLPVLESVGLAAAPADAVPDVLQRVHWISERRGGDGAVRDLIERVLRAQGAWDDLVARYTGARAR